MASPRPLALFLLCILLPAPPVSAALLFGAGKSAKAAAAGMDMEWHPATATWYGDAEGDGSDAQLRSAPHHTGGLYPRIYYYEHNHTQ
nr:unnamed protein product [Digitaria exilis]